MSDKVETSKLPPLTVVVTDYWSYDGTHRPYTNILCSPDTDVEEALPANGVLQRAIQASGAVDGDEVEVVVRKTGRRPFGDRRVLYVEPHTYERETEAEAAVRVAAAGGAKF